MENGKKPESRSKGEDVLFLQQNDQIDRNKISFRKTINIIFMSLLAPFIVQNTVDPELGGGAILGSKLPICPKEEFFFGKYFNIISMYLLVPFIAQN